MKYFSKVRYLGTDFHGFQVQPDKRTVQGELSRALREALGCECRVTGCSRTDAGVHANEFCITVEAEGASVPPDKLPVAVARFLPTDLSLFYAEECPLNFHPRYDVKSKEYLYKLRNDRIYNPFEYGRVHFLSRLITDLGLSRMREAALHIVGRHDFASFMSEGSDVSDTVREVFYLVIDENDGLIEIKISADGFLYNMVRIIVGTLLEVAYGRMEPADVKDVIASKSRARAGMTAPAEGLYLNHVVY